MPIEDRFGAYLPTTFIFDPDNPAQLRWILNDMAIVINSKETGIYTKTEFVTGKTWFPDPALSSQTPKKPIERMVFRKVIDFGALPNAATKTVAHGITFPAVNTFSATHIYGATTDPTGGSYLPLPYAAITDNQNIELSFDNTDVIITTGINRVAYTKTYVVFEFIKE